MSIEVANATETLGQFASNGGYADFIAAVDGKTPALLSLVTHGASEDVPVVVKDLDELIGGDAADDVKSTAKALRELIDGEELVIVTDGTSDEGEVAKLDQASTDDPARKAAGVEGVPGGPEATQADFELTADIVKLDKAEHLVFGWASICSINGRLITDTQGDQIDPVTIESAAYDFVLHARVAGHMHKTEDDEVEKVGQLVESVVFTEEKTKAMLKSLKDQGIDAKMDFPFCGWWIGFHVLDEKVWSRIVSGELPAFSVGGRGKRAVVSTAV